MATDYAGEMRRLANSLPGGGYVRSQDSILCDATADYIDYLETRLTEFDSEVAGVLVQLDELAELWGDEAKFKRCRDRLRAITEKGGG